MLNKERIKVLVEEQLAKSENYLVDLDIKPDKVVVVEIDNNGAGVSIDDCAALSRDLREALGEEAGDYDWEVGSAGITAPLKVSKQYEKNLGKEVEVRLKSGAKLTGILQNADADKLTLRVQKQIKPEGAKRKQTVEEDIPLLLGDIDYTKHIIRFK
jgi:ribosome maturation factor RimP